MHRPHLFLGSLLVIAGCAAEPTPAGDRAFDGPGVEINVAALNLTGVGDVVWDLEVVNGAGGSVWQRRVTSSAYGDSAGSASYVGPCDADPAASANTVRVWVVGVYAADVASAGTFASGDATGVTGTATPFQNPTSVGAAGALTRTFTCVENGDVAVQFDVALMRPAQQGFFDIAVNFNNIFCSAKFDCCEDTNGNGCEAGEDIELLFTAGAGRGRTMVLGFACTAGAGAGVENSLYLDDLELDCSPGVAGFQTAFSIAPDGGPGNLCTAGDMASCAAITDPDPAEADTYLYQVAVYRGQELVSTGGVAANKLYWNVALGVTGAIGDCTLRTSATADDAANALDGLVAGAVTSGAVYPYVSWDVPLGTCASEPLSFDGTGAVQTRYTTTNPAAETTFAYSYAASLLIFGAGTQASPFASSPPLASCMDYEAAATTAPADGYYTIDVDGDGVAPFRPVYCDFTHSWEVQLEAVNATLADTRTFCTSRGLNLAVPLASEIDALVTTFSSAHGASVPIRLDMDIQITGDCASAQNAQSNAGAYRAVSAYLLPGTSQCSATYHGFILGGQARVSAGGFYSAVPSGYHGGSDHTAWTRYCTQASTTACNAWAAPEVGPFPVCSWVP
ncbi:MAG: hypothetical protein EP329_09400 [Deltaproteobacteria bacterium]|nr:MAG: hypothetical protein EP329_09400 [Deltaproteobacteria bacterium]